jgi:ribosomal protein S27E
LNSYNELKPPYQISAFDYIFFLLGRCIQAKKNEQVYSHNETYRSCATMLGFTISRSMGGWQYKDISGFESWYNEPTSSANVSIYLPMARGWRDVWTVIMNWNRHTRSLHLIIYFFCLVAASKQKKMSKCGDLI